eukprot:s1098_g7.t1
MLVIDGDELETTQSCAIQTGSGPSGDGGSAQDQRSRERESQVQHEALNDDGRHALRRALSALILTNRSEHCYANSAWISMLWAMVSRNNFTFNDWGERAPLFPELIQSHQSHPLELAQQPWYVALLLSWPEEAGIGSSDCAEFVALLLAWVCSRCYSGYWEKRAQLPAGIHVHDRGSIQSTLTLQIEPELALDGIIP